MSLKIMILYFRLLIFMSQIVLYFLPCTSVLSFYIGVALTLSHSNDIMYKIDQRLPNDGEVPTQHLWPQLRNNRSYGVICKYSLTTAAVVSIMHSRYAHINYGHYASASRKLHQ